MDLTRSGAWAVVLGGVSLAPGDGDGEGGVSSDAFLGEAAPAAGGKDAHWSPSEYEWDPVAMVRAVLCCGQDLIAVSALMPPPQAAAPLAQRSVGPLQPVLPAGDPSLAVERNDAAGTEHDGAAGSLDNATALTLPGGTRPPGAAPKRRVASCQVRSRDEAPRFCALRSRDMSP